MHRSKRFIQPPSPRLPLRTGLSSLVQCIEICRIASFFGEGLPAFGCGNELYLPRGLVDNSRPIRLSINRLAFGTGLPKVDQQVWLVPVRYNLFLDAAARMRMACAASSGTDEATAGLHMGACLGARNPGVVKSNGRQLAHDESKSRSISTAFR